VQFAVVGDSVESGGVLAVVVARQKPDRAEPGAGVGGEIPGLLGGPVSGGVGGDAGDVESSGGVFKEDEDVEPVFQCGVDVEEVNRDDGVGLAGEELPPGRAATARCWVDACGVENLSHG
jgi:hypothetical protein